MKTETKNLTGAALDWAVAKCESVAEPKHDGVCSWWFVIDGKDRTTRTGWAQSFNPSSKWEHAGPIIERERIILICPTLACSISGDFWDARVSGTYMCWWRGTTPLEAAMRCYVASKLGDVVDVPDELTA